MSSGNAESVKGAAADSTQRLAMRNGRQDDMVYGKGDGTSAGCVTTRDGAELLAHAVERSAKKRRSCRTNRES